MAEDLPSVERIRRDLLAYIEAHPDGVSADAIHRDVRGRDQSLRLTLAELVNAAEVVSHEGQFYPAGWQPPPPDPLDMSVCDRCSTAPEPCGKPASECWMATWIRAGRPMEVGEWEAAGRPGRRTWRARGGLFSYDAGLGHGDCGTANGWEDEMCGRIDCVDCAVTRPPGLCWAPTSRGRRCRRPADRCGLPGHARVDQEG